MELGKIVGSLETANKELKGEIETGKRKLKNNNFVIFGIEGAPETETLEAVQKTRQGKLNIKLQSGKVNNTYIIGKSSTSCERPVILELVEWTP
ncbi:hypothetical protein JTB14_020819 [Gonioctena quinquepunctata]|nr:hypothetical protein JTB14_020819 [Gonioctena quinquepunctata]